MKKHPKQAFGIFHDGLDVRLVHLSREGGEIYLQALDHTELDKYWYKILEDPSVSMVDSQTMEDKVTPKSELDVDEFDNDYVANYQLQPSERMLSSFDMKQGVIAINVYEDNIVKDDFGLTSKKDVAAFVKSKLSPKQIKGGDWKTSVVSTGGHKQTWLHKGSNRLLDMLRDYQRTNKIPMFYQLADANDVALTDYFRLTQDHLPEHDTLLVYLGQEYRKAFLFQNGEWMETLKLQITQSNPEPEVISSKLALAIDSGQLKEPDTIVVCGDMATEELVEFIKSQFTLASVELLSFRKLVIAIQDSESIENATLLKYTIPIALAYKALFPDDDRFTPSNFLPPRIVEGQKVFKVAWHGFIVLFFVFAVAFIFTNLIMKSALTIRQELSLKRDLEYRLELRRREADEIQKIRTELNSQEKNIEVLQKLLTDKNPWTEILNTANQVFSGQPQSWLTNMKLEEGVLILTGVTTKRAAIVEFAKAFPGSQIHKVSHSKIKGNPVWSFEMSSPLLKIDWIGEIQRDMESLLQLRQQVAEAQTRNVNQEEVNNSTNKAVTIRPIAPQNQQVKKSSDNSGRVVLPVLSQKYCPLPSDEDLTGDGNDIQDYYTFVKSVNRGSIWEYREIGNRFIAKHPNSNLLSIVRWWMSYRLYLDREYGLSASFLDPMLKNPDRYYHYALLLQARVDYAIGKPQYLDWYNQLKRDFALNPLIAVVKADLELINKGSGR
jgi:hypothetical protein